MTVLKSKREWKHCPKPTMSSFSPVLLLAPPLNPGTFLSFRLRLCKAEQMSHQSASGTVPLPGICPRQSSPSSYHHSQSQDPLLGLSPNTSDLPPLWNRPQQSQALSPVNRQPFPRIPAESKGVVHISQKNPLSTST